MGYVVNWEDAHFPRIVESERGQPLADALSAVLRHHMTTILTHLNAMQRTIDDAIG